jgi:DNA-binding NtrC family response regulator
MNPLNEATIYQIPGETQTRNRERCESSFPRRGRKSLERWRIASGLVVREDEIRRRPAETLEQCGFVAVYASTVDETRMRLFGQRVSTVLCEDRLPDGNYEGVLRIVNRDDPRTPVIVVSRTGDWPEYLAATRAGAFDYLAYPAISGEFQHVIRDALRAAEVCQHPNESMSSIPTFGLGEPV